jgi:hypothetical protein
MIQSNITLDSITQVAAYQLWSGGISRLVTGKEEVSRFIEDSKDSFATLYLFSDEEFAMEEYQKDFDSVYNNDLFERMY